MNKKFLRTLIICSTSLVSIVATKQGLCMDKEEKTVSKKFIACSKHPAFHRDNCDGCRDAKRGSTQTKTSATPPKTQKLSKSEAQAEGMNYYIKSLGGGD